MSQMQIAESPGFAGLGRFGKGKIRAGFHPYTYVRTNVMRTFLLKKEEYHKLLKMSFNEIVKYLQDSTYRNDIDRLATGYSGPDLLEAALNENLRSTFSKLRRISSEELNLVISQYLKRYDIEDLKTALRGRYTGSDAASVRIALVGAGSMSVEELSKLAEIQSVEDIIRRQRIVDIVNLSQALNEFKENNTLIPIENALDRAYYNELISFARRLSTDGNLMKEFLLNEIEIKNVLALMRLKRENLDSKRIAEYMVFSDDAAKRFWEVLLNITDISDMAKKLEKKDYGHVIRKGMESLKENNSMIELETGLYAYLLRKSISLVHRNILSVDVILGYMFAKEIEIRNLRILLKGKQLGLEEEFIERQLVV